MSRLRTIGVSRVETANGLLRSNDHLSGAEDLYDAIGSISEDNGVPEQI